LCFGHGAPHDAPVHGDVLIHHPLDPERSTARWRTRRRSRLHTAGQPGGHLVEIAEYDAGDPVVHDFAHGAAVERGDGRAAGHGFREHQARTARAPGWIEQRPRTAVQLHLGRKIGLAMIDHMHAVDVRRDFLTIIVVFGGGEHEPHPHAPRDGNRLSTPLPSVKRPRNSSSRRALMKGEVVGVDTVQHRRDDVGPGEQLGLLVRDGDKWGFGYRDHSATVGGLGEWCASGRSAMATAG